MMKKYKYHPMHMHIHSCHQQGGSMESHIYNAASLGMKYIRFTDHDTRTGISEHSVNGFDFSKEELVYSDYEDGECGWKKIGEPGLCFITGQLKISSSGSGQNEGIEFFSTGKRHNYSLLSDVTVTLGMRFDVGNGGAVAIDVRLSQRPPDHLAAHHVYYVGDSNPLSQPHQTEKLLQIDEKGQYVFHISDEPVEGGIDNVFDTISIIVSGNASVTVSHFEISAKHFADDVIRLQREVADKVGEKYGVKPFVTTEISGAGQHKNCFSTCVPVINYAERNYRISEREAIDHVKKYKGIFAYNHPFENNKYKKMKLKPEEVKDEVRREAASLISSRVLGATLIEVGFVEGRGCFTLQDHLDLWDTLTLAGVMITGYGDSDSHFSSQGWFSGNNFATWIAAEEGSAFPISEEEFEHSMRAGNVYMGDPVYLHTDVELSCDGHPIGSAFFSKKARECVFKVANLHAGESVRIIIDGKPALCYTATKAGEYRAAITVKPERTVSFIRAEMYNPDGRCIMLTNPIYFVDPERYASDIPYERIVATDSPEIIGVYQRDLTLPDTIGNIRGKKLLHIGDTASYEYPYYKKLIEVLHPDIILHTGDLADEVKVGRIPGTKNEYLSKALVLLEILRSSGAEIIIVPGNNDLPEEIKRLIPEAKVYGMNSTVKIDGVECRIGHMVSKMTFDQKWNFYGHGFTGDEWATGEDWHYENNVKGVHCRFNACAGSFICSLSEDFYDIIPIPKIKIGDVK